MFPGQRDKQKSNFIAPPPGDLLVKLIWLELDQHLSPFGPTMTEKSHLTDCRRVQQPVDD